MTYLITIELKASREDLSRSRVLDLAEALERTFHRTSAAAIDINDKRALWNQVLLTVASTPKLPSVMAVIQETLAALRLDEIARIRRKRLDGPRPAAKP